MEQETSILRYTELTAILHSTSKKELTVNISIDQIKESLKHLKKVDSFWGITFLKFINFIPC